MYSSMLDPYEPPRTRPIYDNPQVVTRPSSLLSRLVVWWTRARARRTVADAGRPTGQDGPTCICQAGALAAVVSPARATDSRRHSTCD
jgi:hypothetical protein